MDSAEFFKLVISSETCLSLQELEAVAGGSAPAIAVSHVEQCGRCAAELAMLQEFQAAPRPDEAETARWIAKKLRRSASWQTGNDLKPRPHVGWWNWRWMTAAAAGFAALMVIAVGLRTQEPALRPPTGSDVMRSASLEGLSPAGDVLEAPNELRWTALPGASSYRVKLMEVDRRVIWSNTTSHASIQLPAATRAKMLPFKTLLWEVQASSSNGKDSGPSATEQFRVLPSQSIPNK